MKLKVNIGRIEELVGGDIELKKALIKMFLDTFDRSIKTLETNLDMKPATALKLWKETNHELKGAAYNLGFNDLGDYCAEYEAKDLAPEQKLQVIENYKTARKGVKELLKTLELVDINS